MRERDKVQEKREREREGEREREREGMRDHGWKDRWTVEREKERLTIARRQVARSSLPTDKMNFL